MAVIIAEDNELVFTLNDLNNLVGMSHMMAEQCNIKIICRKQNNFIYVEGISGIYKIIVNASGNLTSNKAYLFSLKKIREFIKNLSTYYKDGEGKVVLKLEYSAMQVVIPSLSNLKIEEEDNWLGD